MTELTEEHKKALTLYLGECWHEISDSIEDWDSPVFCLRCKEQVSWTWTPQEKPTRRQHQVALNRTFETPADLHAIYSRMVELKDWKGFCQVMWRHYQETDEYADIYLAFNIVDESYFHAWLSCYGCESEIPTMMVRAAEFVGRKE